MQAAQSLLSMPTLVLNKGFQAIMVIAARDAIAAIYAGKAEAVNHADPSSYATYSWADWSAMRPEADDDQIVRTVKQEIVVPRVIRCLEYSKLPTRGATCTRANIFKRDKYTCQYVGCQNSQPGLDQLTLDHVMPRASGGEHRWENLVTACYTCNQRKANRTPRQAGMKLRRQPMRPEWKPMYALPRVPIRGWQKFLEDVYWNVPLQED